MKAPDLDRTVNYPTDPHGRRAQGHCRLRAWHEEKVAVVTELATNESMSVTNAAEHLAETVEAILDVSFTEPGGWQLVEHYDANSYVDGGHVLPTLDLVGFLHRDHDGHLHNPVWVTLPAEHWLRAALAPISS